MQTLILTLHIIVCVLLVILVLLQAGKEGMGVIFGGGNSSVFGSSGAGGMLAKLTAFIALLFVVTSLSYTFVTSSRPSTASAVLEADVQFEEMQPAASAPKAEQAPAVPAAGQSAAPAEAPAVAAPADAQAPAPAGDAPSVPAEKPAAAPAAQ
ncbi:MAG: preprotein translocase subunit SecG [Desulfovibrionaceae bacterium]|nr:preprotein translocase subunit SecG [Desulfovibrionaceae bacterium]